ncbi:MAG: copper amine oxidase N-terminal domain-containing protein, partial [Clostridia bacterium]
TVNGESVDLQSTNLSTYMYEENGNTMVPVRAVAEKMGYEVNWNGEDMSVTVESDTWKVVMYIGVDNYFGVTKIKDAVGMSAPQSYNASPCLIEDTTFVPAKMFELMGYSYSAVGQFVNFEDRNASTQIANPVVPIAESVK